MAVGAVALVAIAFFVKDMRDDRAKETCFVGVQAYTFGPSTRGFDEDEYVEAVEACGFDVPDD